MRKNNKADMTVSEQLQAIGDRFCADYCKHGKTIKTLTDDELSEFMKEHCKHCPVTEL